MLEKLPAWIKNKWFLFGASLAAALLIGFLIFQLFLRGPLAGLLTEQGEEALRLRDFGKAADKFSTALTLKKNREAIYLGYSDALIGLKEPGKATEILDEGIDRLSGAESLYLAKAALLAETGRIGAAADFLSNIKDTYINKKIQSSRPGDLNYSPLQGKYGKTQKVTLQAKEGETIYYTLNGEDPTLASAVYKEPITVSTTSTLTAIAVNQEGLVSPRLKLTYEIDNANEAIEFTDRKIEKMVRKALDRTTGNLYAAQLASLTELNNDEVEGDIRSLKDLEYLPHLQTLRINNELLIEDYTPLSSLSELRILSMAGCALSDTDLSYISNLTLLTELSINDNKITSLRDLDHLSELVFLNACNNKLNTTVDLAAFPRLNYLHLSDNNLYDLSGLAGLGELLYLDISNNSVSDLSPLADLPKLEELLLRGNRPDNVKALSKLPALSRLDLSACGLASLSVVNDCMALTALTAEDNKIASLSTFQKQVTELYISGNPLADLSPLRAQTGLVTLEAANTKIMSVTCLADLKTLVTLNIANTAVVDATMLKDCTGLNFLVCSPTCKTDGLPEAVEVIHLKEDEKEN